MFKILLTAAFGLMCMSLFSMPAIGAVTDNFTVPFSEANFVECANGGAGEIVNVSGRLHVLATLTEDAAGGIHLSMHLNLKGMSGVGETSGDTWRGGGVSHESIYVAADEMPFIENFVFRFNLIGKGGDPSLKNYIFGHSTVNANGEVSVVVFSINMTCK